MKNKKGFTLIELLAIIVILAVIAVITTPIILNVIENSKKGAAQDSALGYKDAVHKYYASRLAIDSSFQMVDSIYEVDSNGYLSDGTNDYEIQVSGKVPSSGFVQIERNIVKNACIGFDDYAVLITDGTVSDTLKGECTSVSEITGSSAESSAVGTVYPFDYVSDSDSKEQTFTAPYTGYYQLEVWGAQGGSYSTSINGGYGGYSTGAVYLTQGTTLYVNVGGTSTSSDGGYNGGGDTACTRTGTIFNVGGGGATHIASKTGVLSTLSNDINKILIVAGGGGSAYYYDGGSGSLSAAGGSAGGFIGNKGNINTNFCYTGPDTPASGGTQSSGGTGNNGNTTMQGSFGQGGAGSASGTGAGGGFYGGGGTYNVGCSAEGAGGGSGYIGYSGLYNGAMYCYGCNETGNPGTKTISTTGASSERDTTNCSNGYSSNPVSKCAKAENGYAKITYLGRHYGTAMTSGTQFAFPYAEQYNEHDFIVPKTGYYKLEVWGASGGNANDTYIGGYGSYSEGTILLNKDEHLYINIGGAGSTSTNTYGITSLAGGYNGGGSINRQMSSLSSATQRAGSGGGATHIALSHGTLASFDTNANGVADSGEIGNILIVAGGGGGANYLTGSYDNGYFYSSGGSAGGASSNTNSMETNLNIVYTCYDSTQSAAGYCTYDNVTYAAASFGQGGSNTSGGGGGFYGGHGGTQYSATGGVGYIGNSRLSNSVMYCYNCEENGDAGTRTISTTGSNKDSVNCPNNYSGSPLTNCAKAGNGYAVITYIGESLN